MLKQAAIIFSFLIANHLTALTCSTPTTLSDPRVDAYWPEISVNDSGDTAVMWILSQKEAELIQISSKSLTTDWSTPETISSPVEDIFDPLPYVDAAGNIYACWSNDAPQNTQIQFAKKLMGKPWSAAKILISLKDDGYFPEMAFSQDHLITTYEQRIANENRLVSTKTINVSMIELKTSEESKKLALSTLSMFSSTNSTLAVSKQGNVVALWEETGDNISLLKASIKNAKDEWSPPETIYQASIGSTSEEGAAIDAKGNLCMVWEYRLNQPNDRTISKIQAVTKSNGKLSDPIDLSNPTDEVSEPKVSCDNEGNFLVVWESVRDHKYLICAAFKPFGQPWQPAIALSNPEEKSVHPQVKADHKGHFVVVWKHKKNKIPSIYGTTFFTKNQTWSLPTRLSPEGARCEEPEFEFDAQGKGTIVWTTTSNGHDTMIQVAALTAE